MNIIQPNFSNRIKITSKEEWKRTFKYFYSIRIIFDKTYAQRWDKDEKVFYKEDI